MGTSKVSSTGKPSPASQTQAWTTLGAYNDKTRKTGSTLQNKMLDQALARSGVLRKYLANGTTNYTSPKTPTSTVPSGGAGSAPAEASLASMQNTLKQQLNQARSFVPGKSVTTPPGLPTPVVPKVVSTAGMSPLTQKLKEQTANPLPPAVDLEAAFQKQLELMRQQMQQQATSQQGIISQLQKQMQDEVAGRDKQLKLYAETEARQAEQEKLMMAERERSVINQRRAYEESLMGATQRLREGAARRAMYQTLSRQRPNAPTPEFSRNPGSLLR
jgi:hypothetical protein